MPIVTGKTPAGLVAHAQKALSEKWWYVWGTFGNTLTESLLASKIKQYPQYNNDALHRPHLGQTVSDCVGLIKGYCMWNDATDKPVYRADLDYNTGMMYNAAKVKGPIGTIPDRAGICVYMQGHVGVYVGDGWVIECAGGKGAIRTPVSGSGATRWTAWFECPFIDYTAKEVEDMSQYLPYTVEVSTFADAALAEEQRKQIADKGYYTFTMNVKGQSHRVCVGRFGTEQEAQKTADDLKKKGIAGFVTTI